LSGANLSWMGAEMSNLSIELTSNGRLRHPLPTAHVEH
jgi:hypothetical protein